MLKFNYKFNDYGHNETLILLHGFLSNLSAMKSIADAHKYINTLLIDLPGFGATKSQGIDYTMNDISNSIVHLVDHLDLKKVHVYGYSMGGRVAISLLSNHSHRFDKFILESTSPGLNHVNEQNTRIQIDEDRAKKIEQDYEMFIKEWEQLPLFQTQKEMNEDLFLKQRAHRLNEDPKEVADSLRKYGTGIQPTYWPKLNQTNKVLILVGNKDQKFVEIGKLMNDRLKNSTIVINNHVGHNIHLENSVKFNYELRTFLMEVL